MPGLKTVAERSLAPRFKQEVGNLLAEIEPCFLALAECQHSLEVGMDVAQLLGVSLCVHLFATEAD